MIKIAVMWKNICIINIWILFFLKEKTAAIEGGMSVLINLLIFQKRIKN